MQARLALKNILNSVLGEFGAEVISRSELERLRQGLKGRVPVFTNALPSGAEEYLRRDHPRLVELRSRYASMRCEAIGHSLWKGEYTSQIDLKYFRGDNPYVWQERDGNAEINYLLTAFHLKSVDTLGLFQRLREDGLFGAQVCRFDDDLLLSRDLLDSISEILFLEKNIRISKIPNLVVLDIGAGYGRFAHRLCEAVPSVERVLCTDAVAESTFICEYYLRFRDVAERAPVVPLDEIEAYLAKSEVKLATNIHSFSECRHSSVCWWLDLLARHRIPYLFLVPNADQDGRLLTREVTGLRREFMSAVLSRGYRLAAKRLKYTSQSVQKYGVSPTHYYLFELCR